MYEVQTNTLCDGWVNTWTIEDNKPEIFTTEDEALEALAAFAGDMAESKMYFNIENYRVRKIK